MLITAHGNSLRALSMYLEQLLQKEITGLKLPTGVPLVYHLGASFEVKAKEYLGDYAAIQAKMDAVANQGKTSKKLYIEKWGLICWKKMLSYHF